MRIVAPIAAAVLLSSCASAVQPPPQPDPASVQTAIASLASLQGPPAAIWEAGDYAVRVACDSYLNAAASRSNEISSASALVGVAGAGASVANPLAGVASSLSQTFLAAFQSAGAIPYTGSTTTLIQNALAAVEDGVDKLPPTTPAQAMLDVEQLWWQCSPGGYAQLVERGISSAQVSAAPGTQSFAAVVALPRPGRVRILVNGR